MLQRRSVFPTLVGVAALALLVAHPVQAQVGTAVSVARNLSFEGRAGIAIPAGKLADMEDAGFTAGLGVSYRIANRIRVRADGDLETLLGAVPATGLTATSDLKLWHYGAGVEAELLRPILTPWTISAGVGAGATTFDFDLATSTKTFFTTSGFARLGYSPDPLVDLFVQGRAYLMFTSAQDFTALGVGGNLGDRLWSFPITGGVAIHLP